MTPAEVEAFKERLGHETEDSMYPGGRRAQLFQQRKDTEGKQIESKQPAKEECVLPPVGRHTESLERPLNPYQAQAQGREYKPPDNVVPAQEAKNKQTKIPKRSGEVPTPDQKKPKLTNDQDMEPGFGVEAGHAISSQETEDVDIPALDQANSPSFASQARDIPTHQVPHIDMTLQDDNDDDPDELHDAKCSQDGPPSTPPGSGIGAHPQSDALLRGNSELGAELGAPACMQLGAPPALINNGPADRFSNAPPPPQVSYTAPQDMPPWLQDIHRGLQSLHTKADRQFEVFSSEIQSQGTRLVHLESVASEHTTKHASTDNRIVVLERKIRQLEEQVESHSRSRSPAARFGGTHSPRSPRSPRNFGYRTDESIEEDLDLVFGGWTDARRDDAIEEAKNIMKDIQSLELVEEVWTPYSRTNFVKVRLLFPDPQAHISKRGKFQTEILDKLKRKSYVSSVPGSEKTRLWMTKSKTPEERARIRAIVLTKEFYKSLPHVDGASPPPFTDSNIEISWNGKVFLGRHQLLGSIHREGEPQINDVLLSDVKGNHLEWYLLSKTFAAATGRPAESLQECWDAYGSTGNPRYRD